MDYALWRLACTDQCISYLNHISFHTRKLIITSAQSTPEYSIAQSNFFASIVFQTGCFCNPGACAKYLGLSHSDLVSNFEAGHVCWDDNDIINGKPTGAVRISFGYMSTFEDAEKFLKFLQSSFVSLPVQFNNGYMLNLNSLNLIDNSSQKAVSDIHLKSIIIYPVKSCQGFSVKSWPLTTGGMPKFCTFDLFFHL